MYRIADRIRIQARSLCAEPAVPINISASPAVAAYLIAPAIAGFTRKHPGITLSLSGVSHHVLLNKSEADIAVRLERPDDPDLMTRRRYHALWSLCISVLARNSARRLGIYCL
ncbi:substrate-binding domain-containing protein [Klebsiella michiganensis]|uniref:substrate-binding domain-containing protein n=1 Tax=Klebsiella michiganensis TaxID=1134687 RepID=UPI0021E0FD52|nr:substrate-binding domain-containing protein [Klebsiella michiganensis]